MIKIQLLIIGLLVICFRINAQTAISFPPKWSFKIDAVDLGERQQWFANSYSTTGWDSMPVPGNWQLYHQYQNYSGKAWYRVEFETPKVSDQQEAVLTFEAVYHDSKVWLNGSYLGSSNSGFFPFQFDISTKLNPNGRNTLVVMADNTFRIGAIWNWGGIRRPVAIKIIPKVDVEKLQVSATPDLVKKTSQILIKTGIYNHLNDQQKVKINVLIKFRNTDIASASKEINVSKKDTAQSIFTIDLDAAKTKLWHFDDPNLYTAELTITDAEGKTIETRSTRFGIRKVEIKGYDLLLNGEPVKLCGYNYVPDDRISGNTLPVWRYKMDIDMMKQAGANMARFSHLPLPEEVLDYLDEKGIMHYAEIPVWGSNNPMVDKNALIPKKWLDKLVNNQFNHAAIIGWSVGNEIGYNPGVVEYVKSAIDHVKNNLDTTRLVGDVNFSANKNVNDPAQFDPIILFNMYGATKMRYNVANVHKNHPGKPIFMSEFGDVLNVDEPNLGVLPIKAMIDSLRLLPYVVGASLWTFNDYRSHYQHAAESWSTPVSENRPWGIINVHRQSKRGYEDVKREFAPIKNLEIIPSKSGLSIKITPRIAGDIPSYILKGYSLRVLGYDINGNLIESVVNQLNDIIPGSKSIQYTADLKMKAAYATVGLYSPLQYNVRDTVLNFSIPQAPVIKEVQADETNARIYFEARSGTREVFARYITGGKQTETKLTINGHVDLKFNEGEKPTVELVAINGKGNSINNPITKLQPAYEAIPPVIYTYGPVQEGFMIGYYSDKRDYLYKVEYSILPDTQTIYAQQSPSRGVMNIKGIPEGKEVRFRFKKVNQSNDETQWTTYRKVRCGIPVQNQVVKSQWTKAAENYVFHFDTHPFASGYEIKFLKGGKVVYTEQVNANYLSTWIVKSSLTGSFDKAEVSAILKSL